MILQVDTPSDSAQIFRIITEFFPGINQEAVALIVGFILTRFIWLGKLLLSLGPILNLGPVSEFLTKLRELWTGTETKRGLGWLINPILMIIMGYFFAGTWSMGALMGFAGIGVREWLIKSPIPTSTADLKKIKNAVGLLVLLGILFIPATAWGQQAPPKKMSYTDVRRLSVAITPGFQWTYDPHIYIKSQKSNPFISGKLSYLVLGNVSLNYSYTRNLERKAYDNKVGLTILLF